MKTVTYPLLGISASMKAGATPKNVHYDVDVAYDKTQVKSKLDAKVGTKHPSDYSVDFEVRENTWNWMVKMYIKRQWWQSHSSFLSHISCIVLKHVSLVSFKKRKKKC